jgi:phosphatidylglycerol lysyltransferase
MHIPLRELWWLAAGGAGYGARYVRLRVNTALRRKHAPPDPTGELLRLQTLYGYNAHSLVSITPGAQLWSTPEIDGAVIYSEFGRVWLAAGDPLASEEDAVELARLFVLAAKKQGRVAAFVPVTERFAREAARVGLGALKVGAAPYFDLRTWSPRGDRAKKLRAGVNQARRAGVRVEAIEEADDKLKRETESLCRQWLNTRRAATSFGWLFLLDPFQHAAHKKFFAARDERGSLVGFLAASPIPSRGGWYIEDVLRAPDAPPGTADLLVFEALTILAATGARLATLGTSPLARDGAEDVPAGGFPVVARALRVASKRLGTFYNFEGLRRFKAKFVPTHWESEYILGPRGVTIPPRVAYAVMRAIAPGGVPQLLTRQAARTLRSAAGRTIRHGKRTRSAITLEQTKESTER